MVAFFTFIVCAILSLLAFAAPVSALPELPAEYVELELPYPSSLSHLVSPDGYYQVVAKVDPSNYVANGPQLSNSLSYDWICKAGHTRFKGACVISSEEGPGGDDSVQIPAGVIINMSYDVDKNNSTNEQIVLIAQLSDEARLIQVATASGLALGDSTDATLIGRPRATYVCPGPPPYQRSAPVACTT